MKTINDAAGLGKALVHLNDAMKMPGVDDIEEHAAEDHGALVFMVYLDNGTTLQLTIGTLAGKREAVK